jgi:hypothetical protein
MERPTFRLLLRRIGRRLALPILMRCHIRVEEQAEVFSPLALTFALPHH